MASDHHQHWQIGNKGKEVTVWKSHKNWLGFKLPGQILVLSVHSRLWIISVKIIVVSAPISLLGTRTTYVLISWNNGFNKRQHILPRVSILCEILSVSWNFRHDLYFRRSFACWSELLISKNLLHKIKSAQKGELNGLFSSFFDAES